MGRPTLENREGRGVRQLEIYHNKRRLGITQKFGALCGLHGPHTRPLSPTQNEAAFSSSESPINATFQQYYVLLSMQPFNISVTDRFILVCIFWTFTLRHLFLQL
jgi:hypothetical protein